MRTRYLPIGVCVSVHASCYDLYSSAHRIAATDSTRADAWDSNAPDLTASQEEAEPEAMWGWRLLRLTKYEQVKHGEGDGVTFVQTLADAVGEAADVGLGQEYVHPALRQELRSKPSTDGHGVTGEGWNSGLGCGMTVPFLYYDHEQGKRNGTFSVQQGSEAWMHKGGDTSMPFPTEFARSKDYLQWWLAVAEQWQLREASARGTATQPICHYSLTAMKQYYDRLDEKPHGAMVLGLPHVLTTPMGRTWARETF